MAESLPTLHEMLSFRGRRALVTGAAGGIGLETAKRFAEAGAAVMMLDRDEDVLQRARYEVERTRVRVLDDTGSAGDEEPRVSAHVLDLALREQIDAFWNGLSDDELPDILVNNAGIYPMEDFLEVDESFWRHTMAVNLDAVFWMCQHFIRRRKTVGRDRIGRHGQDRRGGAIVNVSSIEAILPFKEDMVPYTTSKAAILTLTRGLARDYAADGFQINVIVPGAIRTPGTQRLVKRALSKVQLRLWRTGYDFQQRLPRRRWGHPDEVARVILFLSSDMASYVQGAVVPVDGGFLST